MAPASRFAGRLDHLSCHDLRHTGQILAAQTGATLAARLPRHITMRS
jgi:integrase